MDRAVTAVRTDPRVHAALTGVALLFSINYIISKVAMRSFSPIVFAYLRIAGGAIIFNLLFRRRENEMPLTRSDRRDIVVFSLLGVVINLALFLGGLALTSAHIAALLVTAVPIFTLGAAIALERERATPWRTAGILIAAVGALTIVGVDNFDGSPKAVLGDIIILVNCLGYALYLVLSKPAMARLTPTRVLSAMFAVGTFLMLPLAAVPLWRQRWDLIDAKAWGALAFAIAGTTVAAYLLNGWALARADSSLVAGYNYLQPFITVVLAAAFLGETIRATALAAGAMIIAGVVVASR
jgi:drug/metabolite transporter (DMT)-like permease